MNICVDEQQGIRCLKNLITSNMREPRTRMKPSQPHGFHKLQRICIFLILRVTCHELLFPQVILSDFLLKGTSMTKTCQDEMLPIRDEYIKFNLFFQFMLDCKYYHSYFYFMTEVVQRTKRKFQIICCGDSFLENVDNFEIFYFQKCQKELVWLMWGYVVFLKSLDTMLMTSLLPVTLHLRNIRSEINLCYTCIWKSAERVTGIVILGNF